MVRAMDATGLAARAGSPQATNVVMLGASPDTFQ